MKSEKEFIDGVYEKYEKQLEIKRRRIKMLSACATLSACACVVFVVAIRTLPVINDVAEDAALAEADFEYSGYSLYSSSDEPEEEAVFDINESYKAAVKTQILVDGIADMAKSYDEDVADDVAPTAKAEAAFESVEEPAEAEEIQNAGEETVTQYSNAGAFVFNLYTSNSRNVYEDKIEYTDTNGAVIATAYLNSAPEFTCVGCITPQIAETDGGYYINYKSGGENIVIFLDGDTYEEKLAKAVAESIVYNEN